jgi:hypothetical protein
MFLSRQVNCTPLFPRGQADDTAQKEFHLEEFHHEAVQGRRGTKNTKIRRKDD